MSKNTLLFFLVLLLLPIVVFLSDLQSTSVKCNDGMCDNGNCINGSCVCKDGWTGPLCQFCDGRFSLTSPEGELHDGVGDYPTNTKCSWLIHTNSTKPIKLTFHHFSTECGWDHLHVFDGPSIYSPLVGSFSGISQSVEDVVLHSGYGFLYFFSDVAYSMGGFNLTYRLIDCPADCSGHGHCRSDSQTCLCDQGWTGIDCSESVNCTNQCSDNGVCENGTCTCSTSWLGEDCSIAASNISWLPLSTQSTPRGRASFGADVLGDFFYAYGGETLLNRFIIHSNNSIAFYRYNILTQTWSSLSTDSSANSDLYGHTLTANSNDMKLYLYGGTENGLPTANLSSYNTLSSSWQSLTSGSIAVTGHTAHIIDNKLYIFFGQNAVYSFVHLIQVYDINNSSWSIEKTSGVMVRGRYGHSSVYDAPSNSVLIFGGYHSSYKPGSYKLSNSMYKYIVNTSMWVGLTPAPRPSFLHSMVKMSEGYLLVSGGNSHNDTVGSSGSQCYSSSLLLYELCCDKWVNVEAKQLTDININRFGHIMYTYNSSVYVYGGFNGVMLSDTLQLHTPDCSQFLSPEECRVGGALMHNQTNSLTLCEWNSRTGCVSVSRQSTCDRLSCNKSTSEEKSRCNQFLDCRSCAVSDGCYYKPNLSVYCGVVPPDSNVNPSLQDPANCPNTSCLNYKNCALCTTQSHCIWSNANNRCLLKDKYSSVISEQDRICQAPCYTHSTCSNCTGSNCLWCESQSQCIDSNSYLTNYIYGQCLEWTTSVSQCSKVACSEIGDCSSCQRNAMCGWCNDQSDTGKGECMRGGLGEDLNSTCRRNGSWHFTSCPACQCNGHSKCYSNNTCIACEHNTTGDNCETCMPGYYGDPTNGGTCKRCECDAVGDGCNDKTGACFCRVQGATGGNCQECDRSRQYFKDRVNNQECYYSLGVDYRYTFNFSKPEDKYVTVINLQTIPKLSGRDMELTLNCKGRAYINLTAYSAPSTYVTILDGEECVAEEREVKISHKSYNFDSDDNATILLTLTEFSTPFVFQVSFTQYNRIDLFRFFLIFFGCFLALLIIAGVVWKLRAHYAIIERRNQERQERQAMASRPFASILLLVDDLKSMSAIEKSTLQQANKPQNTRQPSTTSEPLATFQRTFSKRSKIKQFTTGRNMASAVGVESLEGQKSAAVSSIIIKLPTGVNDVPGYGCSGLAIGSTLISIPAANSSNYALTKVSYKQGKVSFKYP